MLFILGLVAHVILFFGPTSSLAGLVLMVLVSAFFLLVISMVLSGRGRIPSPDAKVPRWFKLPVRLFAGYLGLIILAGFFLVPQKADVANRSYWGAKMISAAYLFASMTALVDALRLESMIPAKPPWRKFISKRKKQSSI